MALLSFEDKQEAVKRYKNLEGLNQSKECLELIYVNPCQQIVRYVRVWYGAGEIIK